MSNAKQLEFESSADGGDGNNVAALIATKSDNDHCTMPHEEHEQQRRLIERKMGEDFELPAVQAYYGHSLKSGPGNCHEAASLVMTALAMESPQLDWRIFIGMQDMADGRGLHSWLEVEGLVVEVAARRSGATEVEVFRNKDPYYEQYRIDVYLSVTLPQWRRWWLVEAGTRWPPRDEDLDTLNRLRRKPVRGKSRRAIRSNRTRMGWNGRTTVSRRRRPDIRRERSASEE